MSAFLSLFKNDLSLEPVPFRSLPGWGQDDFEVLLPSLIESLQGMAEKTSPDLKPLLQKLIKELKKHSQLTYALLEQNFKAYKVIQAKPGLFTGYYEPIVQVTENPPESPFLSAIYERPNDLFYIPDLGTFNPRLAGERLAGRLEDKTLSPYMTRGDVYAGKLEGLASVIAWAKNPVDLYFMHIQGSGVLQFEGGSPPVGYSSTNGHPYTSLCQALIQTKKINPQSSDMSAVKTYLQSLSRSELVETLGVNASYIFFEKRQDQTPIGSFGLPLIPKRSLAVDPYYIPLGLPLWLDCEHPIKQKGRLQRFMLAQDTGSAIKGPIRGDFFWGTGDEAGLMAGQMIASGFYYLLLPHEC